LKVVSVTTHLKCATLRNAKVRNSMKNSIKSSERRISE